MICPSCQFDNIQGADECANCGASLYGLDFPGNKNSAPDFIHLPLSSMRMRSVIKVGAADPVALAIRHMKREEVNCVIVTGEDGAVEGILTNWDVLQKVAGPTEDLNAVTCGQVMTAHPYMLNEDDTIALALNAMAAGGFRHVPVQRDDEPIGVIIASDLFRHLSPHLV